MLTLAIETSNPSTPPGGAVAIGRVEGAGVTLLAREAVAAASRDRDDLTPAIERAARGAGVVPGAIACVAVSIGPGGYTALRMAVATAKMIAWSTGARCVGVPTALVAAEGAEGAGLAAPFAVALAGKAGGAFVTFLPRGWREAAGTLTGQLVAAEQLGPLARGAGLDGAVTLLGDAHVPAELRAAAVGLGWGIEAPVLDPVALLRLAAVTPGLDPELLAPRYGREPEAVTLWRARHGPKH